MSKHDPLMTRYLFAISWVTRMGPSAEEGVELTVMFLAGPFKNPRARQETADLARTSGKDVVYLEFERGNAAKGPRNIMVFEHVDGELVTYPRCAVWSRGRDDLCVILPRGRDVCFAYNGTGLQRMTGAPTEDLTLGLARGKTELIAIANRLTPEMLAQMVAGASPVATRGFDKRQ